MLKKANHKVIKGTKMMDVRWCILLVMSSVYASESVYDDLGIGRDQQPRYSSTEALHDKTKNTPRTTSNATVDDYGREELGIDRDQYPDALDELRIKA